MKIQISSAISCSPHSNTVHSNTTNNFSEDLTSNIASQKMHKEPKDLNDILTEVKEKGLLKYVQEQREAELRAKVLSLLGVTEEELAAMPPAERVKMEERIAKAIEEEIKKRQAVAAALNGEDDPQVGEATGQVSFQVPAEQTGMENALSALEIVLENRMAYIDEKNKQKSTIEILTDVLKKNIDIDTRKV
jgi:hypothetical protein